MFRLLPRKMSRSELKTLNRKTAILVLLFVFGPWILWQAIAWVSSITHPFYGSADNAHLIKKIHEGDVQAVKQIIKDGGDVNFTLGWRGAPLVAAFEARQFKIFKMLLKSGADPNVGGSVNNIAEIVIERNVSIDWLKALFDAGLVFKPELQRGSPKFTTHPPLVLCAIAENMTEHLLFLIGRGAKLNHRNSDGADLLELAIWYEAWDCALILVEAMDEINHIRSLKELERQEKGTDDKRREHAGRLKLIEMLAELKQ